MLAPIARIAGLTLLSRRAGSRLAQCRCALARCDARALWDRGTHRRPAVRLLDAAPLDRRAVSRHRVYERWLSPEVHRAPPSTGIRPDTPSRTSPRWLRRSSHALFLLEVVFSEHPLALDGVAAGVAAGAAVTIKPSTALFIWRKSVRLAFAWARRGTASRVPRRNGPAVIALAVWKGRGLGHLPLLNGIGPHPVDSASPDGAPARPRRRSLFQPPQLVAPREQHRSSPRALLERSGPPVARHRGGWSGSRADRGPRFLLVGAWIARRVHHRERSYVTASVEDASVFRIMMPAFPSSSWASRRSAPPAARASTPARGPGVSSGADLRRRLLWQIGASSPGSSPVPRWSRSRHSPRHAKGGSATQRRTTDSRCPDTGEHRPQARVHIGPRRSCRADPGEARSVPGGPAPTAALARAAGNGGGRHHLHAVAQGALASASWTPSEVGVSAAVTRPSTIRATDAGSLPRRGRGQLARRPAVRRRLPRQHAGPHLTQPNPRTASRAAPAAARGSCSGPRAARSRSSSAAARAMTKSDPTAKSTAGG